MECRTKMLNYECPTLNIGVRKGSTSYIDFIQERELRENAVMKGVDCIGRPFLAVKAEYVLSNGETVPTFSTFFKRYVDVNNIWHCCGHDGLLLLHTEGGMQPKQFDFLNQLLYEKEVDIDTDTIAKYRLCYNIDQDEQSEKNSDEIKAMPIKIRLREASVKKYINPRFVF